MKKVLSLLVMLFTLSLLTSCGEEKEFDFSKGELVVGLEAGYAPFNWFETEATDYNYKLFGEDNRYVAGYDVEIAKRIADHLGLELVIKQIVWDALISNLKSNDIDLIIAGMSLTEERKKSIDFTEAYYTSNHVVVVKKGNALENATSLTEFKGKKGVGQIDTVYATLVDYVAEKYGAIALPVRDDVSGMSLVLNSGDADFIIVEKPVALGLLRANSDYKIILDVEENIFEVSDEDREVSIGLRKIDTSLKEKVNEALAKITKSERDAFMNEAVEKSE